MERTGPKRRMRWYHKILLPVISAGVFVGLSELACWGLRLAPPKRPPFKFVVRDFENDVEHPFMVEDSILWWAPKAGYQGQGYGTDVHINSAGFRDREYPLRKSPGVFRILCLGDSTTFGFCVPIELTYHSILEERLNQDSRPPDVHCEVINGGVTGYSSQQCLLMYECRGRKLRPDLVLLNVGANDLIEKSHLSDSELLRGPTPSLVRSIDDGLSNLHSYRALHRLVWGPTEGEHYEHGKRKVPRGGLEAFKQNIAKLEEFCRMDGCQLVLISFTYCGQIPWSGNYAHYDAVIPRYREALEAVAHERHIPLVTVPTLTERSTTPNYHLFMDKFHPTPGGHRLLARAIQDFLQDRGLLPQTVQSPSTTSDKSLDNDKQ